ncbi:MAG: serine protease [Solirubrobacterales bacterium]|nr:serine protease [Solirubrobacterales bacterium]MCB8914587.1 serine protease [Thermoleophilales bacterium]
MLKTSKKVMVLCALALTLAGLATAPPASARVAPVSESAATASVVGGTNARGSHYPWQVLITANGKEFCGGVLIHPMIILTAAHCLVDEKGNYYEDLSGVSFRAFAGRTSLGSGGEALDWNVARVDPAYDPDRETHDWGFITLKSAASAPTLKLAGPDERALWKPGRTATVTGFGKLSDGGKGATVLQQLRVPVLANSGCSRYGSIFRKSTMLCAGYRRGGKDSCQGDSGGPLSVAADGGQRRLIGIVSVGNGCAMAGFPGIYARIASPANSARIQMEVRNLESLDSFPSGYTGISVIGSGARPLGCAAAMRRHRQDRQLMEKRKRAVKAARRYGKRSRVKAAKWRLGVAKHRFFESRTTANRACS